MNFRDFARNEKAVSGVAAVVMHLLFVALLVFGVSWQKREPDSAMVVDLWESLPPAAQPRPQAVEPKREPEPPKPPPPPKPEPKPEPKPAPKPPPPPPKPEVKPAVKPDIALKEKLEKERRQKELEKAEKEKKLKEEQAQKQKERERAEAKKREEEKKAQQQKELAEKKRLAQEAAEKKRLAQEAAEKKRLAEEAAEKQRAAQEAADAQRKLAAAQAAASQKMIDEYKRRIRDKVRRFIVEPPNVNPKAEVEFDIVVLPGGEVLSAKLKRSANSTPAYDSAVERAILRAQPLPLPPDPALMNQFRELNLVFRPQE